MHEFLNMLYQFDWRSAFSAIGIIFIIFDVILLFAFIFTVAAAWKYRPQFKYPKRKNINISAGSVVSVEEEWSKIIEKVQDGSSHSLTLAIIDADKLLDDTLQVMGLSGEHFSERFEALNKIKKLKSAQSVWQAHRIRNNLVHASGFQIAPKQAQDVLRAYEALFKEIDAL